MSFLLKARMALVSLVALGSFIAVATAGAASWQGPSPISATNVNADGAKIALGPSGDGAAIWLDDAVAGGRIAMARKRAGAAWSAPVTVVTPFNGTVFSIGVDGSGNITATYATGNATAVVSWPAAAAAPTSTQLAGALTVTDFAVDASGDAVLAGLSGNPAELTVGYRHGAGGGFVLKTYAYTDLGFSVSSARVAINAAGMAVVVFVVGPQLRAVTHTASTDWQAAPENVETTLAVNGDPAVGIDGAGNVLAAYTYHTATPAKVMRTARRPAAGTWVPSGDLSDATANASADFLNVAVSPSGTAALVWSQTSGGTASVKALYGTSTSGVGSQIEDVGAAGSTYPVAAIGNDGSVVAAWERFITGGSLDEAEVRSPGPAGAWSVARPLSGAHPNTTFPSLAGDGLGDFATVITPYDGTYHPVMLSYYDAAPPVLTGTKATGAAFVGNPVTLSTASSDAWSTVGAPTWTFGDGATGTGPNVTHAYAAPGTYTAHVSVADTAGNAAAADVTVVVTQVAQATLTKARFSAKWKRSRLSGTLLVAGTAPVAGTYVIDVSKGRTPGLHVSLKLAAGPFSRMLKLRPRLIPGSYRVALLPASTSVRSATTTAKLPAPPEGVVDLAALSGKRNGKAVHTLVAAPVVWGRFHFAAVAKGKVKLTWYLTFKGKRSTLRTVTKRPFANISDSFALLGRRGTITAVLRRAGKVIVQSSIRVRKL